MLSSVSARPLQVAICGGGASAVLLLSALARQAFRPLALTIFEPRPRLGQGVAYSTDSSLHLLNVPAGRMVTGEDPASFLRWLRAERPRADGVWSGDDFAPRALYGQFLETLCETACAAPHLQVTHVRSLVQRVLQRGDGWSVVPACGAAPRADVVVVATGNEPPTPLGRGLESAVRSRIIENPWDSQALDDLAPDASVLLVGTGLTAVDVALELLHARRHTGPLIACSRRALLPRPHGARAPLAPELCRQLEAAASLREILRLARSLAARDPSGAAWRGLMDELRRGASTLWARLSLADKGRFLRHLRPFWEVHRHRLAPAVHAGLEAAMASGRLRILKGRIESVDSARFGGLEVRLRQPGAERVLSVARIINCTGPRSALSGSANPLLASLRTGRLAMDDAFGLGLATDAASRLIGADRCANPTLFALGALARGVRFELTAIPEIAEQARRVAREILALPQQSADAVVRRNIPTFAVHSRL